LPFRCFILIIVGHSVTQIGPGPQVGTPNAETQR
jgi:hypothetical protein